MQTPRPFAIALLVLIGLAVPATAHALNPPTLLKVGHLNRHPSADWTLPANVRASVVEVATSPDVASDGQFFSENVEMFDLLSEADTHYLAADRLKPGTYYVHVRGYDNSCFVTDFQAPCGPVWSNTLSLTITNRAPTIEALRWRMTGRGRGYGYYVTVVVRLRVCDDVANQVTTYRDERSYVRGTTFAHTRDSDYGVSMRVGCSVVSLSWRLQDRFFGIGYYTAQVWVQDQDGAKSRVVKHTWFTAD